MGILDTDGFVVLTGRIKDIIIRKGENISAVEIEDLLYEHPKVMDAAVVGLPDPERGERACAVVTCADSRDPLTLYELVSWCRDAGLMAQKIPEQLEIVAEMPRNTTGKILKYQLRERYKHTSIA
jgi:acyl-CoA synthetase (AMP-forming)/AMP-acid ligase II